MMRWTATMMAALLVMAAVAMPAAGQSSKAQREAAREVLQAHRDAAVQVVLEAARAEEPALRANAIEAMQPLPERARPLAQLGLEDDNLAVQFSALVTIGELKLEGLGETARQRIDHSNPSVRAAAIFAARRCGEDVDLTPLADLLRAQDPTVRGNAAMLLGMLGDASAAPMIKDLAHAPMPRASSVRQAIVRIQTAEALVQLGEDQALDAIRAGMYSQHDEVRVLAVQTLGKLGDQRMGAAIAQIVEGDQPIELRLAGAEALARMKQADETCLKVAREGAAWDKPAVRAQAAFMLARLERPEAAERLTRLLNEDEDHMVRLSAAAAVLRGLPREERE